MNDFKCPITGLLIKGELVISSSIDSLGYYYYPIELKDKTINISLCYELFDLVTRGNNEIINQIDKIRTILTYELIAVEHSSLKGKVFHWNCKDVKPFKHLLLKDLIQVFEASHHYPKNRRQKADNILNYLYNNQLQDGGKLRIEDKIWQWGSLFMRDYNEFIFYLEELKAKNLIALDKTNNLVNLTFDGLDSIENLLTLNNNHSVEFYEPQFDIGLSFAGEDRSYANQISSELQKLGVKVFYDDTETADLWGKDLYQHLNDIYKNKCKYCIIFISKHYANKLWTRHELKAAQARAFVENAEYILPIRIDETELPGINPQISYIDINKFSSSEIAYLAHSKLQK